MARYGKISSQYEIKKPFVKVKFADFTTTTVESVLYPQSDLAVIMLSFESAGSAKKQPVRLLGLGISLNIGEEIQLTLF